MRRAFTLIELLVVIAIIAILAAILFPVFSRARAEGHRAACISNQRQLVQANAMYASDTGRYAPAAQDYFEHDRLRWFGVRGRDGKFVPRAAPLVTYLKDGGLLRRCGAFETKLGFDVGTGGYVYNAVGVGSLVWEMGYVAEAWHVSRREFGIARPAETAMFADGALDIGVGLVEYGFLEPPPSVLRRLGSPYDLDPSLHFRHGTSCQVGFVDGHVAPRKMALSTERSGIYAGANPREHGLGWIGPTEDKTPYGPD